MAPLRRISIEFEGKDYGRLEVALHKLIETLTEDTTCNYSLTVTWEEEEE